MRKMSLFEDSSPASRGDNGGASRRKSSVFLNYDQQSKALTMMQEKLKSATSSNAELELKCREMASAMDSLSARFVDLKLQALDCSWRYCVEHSSDFKDLPHLDNSLLETETRCGNYLIFDVLGRGQFSVVKSCERKDKISAVGIAGLKGSVVGKLAVKMIAKDKLTSIESVVHVEREVRALKILTQKTSHPNVVQFVEALHGTQNIYIVTEGFQTDLFGFIDDYKSKLNDNIVACIIRELLEGLAHLAVHCIVHRDLKPENVLILVARNEIKVKICDFGLCSFLPLDGSSSMLSDFCGSPGFHAPEVALHLSFCGYKADIFSVGCIALEMLISQSLFTNTWLEAYKVLRTSSKQSQFHKALREAVTVVNKELHKKHLEAHDTVSSMLQMQPIIRPLLGTLKQNTWLTKASKNAALDVLTGRAEAKKMQAAMHARSQQPDLSPLSSSFSPASSVSVSASTSLTTPAPTSPNGKSIGASSSGRPSGNYKPVVVWEDDQHTDNESMSPLLSQGLSMISSITPIDNVDDEHPAPLIGFGIGMIPKEKMAPPSPRVDHRALAATAAVLMNGSALVQQSNSRKK